MVAPAAATVVVDLVAADESTQECPAGQDTERKGELQLFVGDRQKYEQSVKRWLKDADTSSRWTIGKISRLKWSLLSQECGGDIATASLVLGLPHPLANVPLYYSLLSVTEATRLFESVTFSLWKDWMEGLKRSGSLWTLRPRR